MLPLRELNPRLRSGLYYTNMSTPNVAFHSDNTIDWHPNVPIVIGVGMAGAVDSDNAVFRLPWAPEPGAGIALYRNGLRLYEGLGGVDYARSGFTVTLAVPLLPGEVLRASLPLPYLVNDVIPVYSEVPTGTINGTNPTFTLAHTPTTDVCLHLCGVALLQDTDFSVSGNTITYLTVIPRTGQWHLADYGYEA